MPETDALQKATSDPDFYALSTGERKQFLSNFDPDFKGLDSKQQDQFLGLVQQKAKDRSSSEIQRVASGRPEHAPPSLGSPKATPELFPGAIQPLPQGKPPVATTPPPQAQAKPQSTPPPTAAGSPQILAEEPPAKPVGPAFVTPYKVAAGSMPSKKSEDPGLEVWGENVANALRQNKYGEAAKAVFASPVDMEAVDRELTNFTYPILGPVLGTYANKVVEGGVSAATSPGNILLGAGIGGAAAGAAKSSSPLIKAAWQTADTALAAYFAGTMTSEAGKHGKEAVDALKKKDYQAAAGALGLVTTDMLFAYLGGVRAIENGVEISKGIQDGVRIGKLRSAMQDELYRREGVRKEQERATRQPPKQIEEAKTDAPPKPEETTKAPASRDGTLEAARKAAESVFGKPTEAPESEEAKPATEEKPQEPKAQEPPPEAATAAKPVEPEKTEKPPAAKEAAPPPPAGTEKMYLQEGAVTEMPKEDIKVDPKRFQFKSKAVGRAGVTEDMSDVESFDPNAAGVLAVWKDPKDGNTYVVNGHHRLERAKSLNYDQPLLVRYIDAESDKDARTIGALINIKEGKGEPIDAAKVFREGGITPEELKKYGISMRGPIAKQGLALSKLSDSVFKKVATGELPEGYGVAIGDILTDEAHQEAAADMATEAQARGRKVTDSEFREALRLRIARAPVAVQETDTLFGKEEMRRSLALEVGEVSDYIKSQLSTDKRLFGAVGKEAAASKLSEGGNVIATEDNAKRSQQAGQAIDLYGRLSGQTGPVSEILDQAAKELAEGGNPRDVKQRAYERVRDQLGNDLSSIYGKGSTPPSKGTGVVGQERGAPPAEAKRPEPRPTDKPPTEAKGKRSLTREQATGDALSKELASKGKAADTGLEQIEDSPIFGGPRQQSIEGTEPPPLSEKSSSIPPPSAPPQEGLFGSERGSVKLSPEAAQKIQEAKAKVKEFAENTKRAGEVVIEMIAPRVGVPKEGMTAVMKALGERNRADFVMEQTMGEIEDVFNAKSRADQVSFMDRYKRGEKQPTEELQAIADTYRDMDRASFEAKRAYKETLPEKENHFRVFWKKIPGEAVPEGGQYEFGGKEGERRGARGGGRRPLSGTRGWMKRSTLADVSDGLRWDFGAPMGEIDTRARVLLKPEEYRISQRGGITEFTPLSDKAHRFAEVEKGRGTTILREGGEPYSYNPQVLFARSMADDLKFVTAHRMWDYLKAAGLRKYMKGPADRPIERTPEGFTDLNDRLAQTFFRAQSGEGVIEAGRWVVEENVGRILNNYLGKDYLRDMHLASGAFEKSAAFTGKALLGLKNFTTGLELAISPFHLVAESLEAASTKFGIGFTRSWNEGVRGGDPKAFIKGLAEILEAPISPYTTAKTGGDIMRAAIAELMPENRPPVQGSELGNIGRAATGKHRQVTDRDIRRGMNFLDKNPGAQRMLGDLFNGGLKMNMAPEYKINTLRAFAENLREIKKGESIAANAIGAVARLLPSINEVLMKPLFETYIPRLKIGFAFQDYGQQLSERASDLAAGKVTREELARQSVDRMENRFGEMNFDNLWWNRTMKTALQIAVRSVTWRLGTVRAFGEAGAGQAKYLAEPVRMMLDASRRDPEAGMKQFIPKLHPSMGWMVGLALTGTVIAEISTRLATGKSPSDWAKEEAKKTGDYIGALTREILHPRVDSKLDERGKPHRMTPPTYLSRDLEPLLNNPRKYGFSGTSSIMSKLPEVWNNEDFFGNFLYDPNDPFYKKVLAGAGHIVGEPFMISTYQREKQGGASDSQIAAGFAGFPPASRDVDRTPAERLTAEFKRRHPHKFTPDELKNIQEHRKLISRYRQGDETVQEDMDKAEMTGSEQASIRRSAGREELVQGVTGLGVKEALRVWDAATPTEKQTIYQTLLKKRHLLNKVKPPSERERLTKEFESKIDAYEEPSTEVPPKVTRTATPPPIGRQ